MQPAGSRRAAAVGLPAKGARVVVVDTSEADGRRTLDLVGETGGEAIFVAAGVVSSPLDCGSGWCGMRSRGWPA